MKKFVIAVVIIVVILTSSVSSFAGNFTCGYCDYPYATEWCIPGSVEWNDYYHSIPGAYCKYSDVYFADEWFCARCDNGGGGQHLEMVLHWAELCDQYPGYSCCPY
jgi:hypothetical protein